MGSYLINIKIIGMISKAALKGMGDSIISFVPILEEKVAELNGNRSSSMDQPLVRTATLSRRSHVSTKESPRKPATAATTSSSSVPSDSSFDLMGWIDTISETVSAVPFSIRAGLMGLFVVWIMWSWLFRSSSKSSTEPEGFIRPLSAPVGRAVYIRDLEDGLLKTELQPPYVDAER